MKYDRPKVIKLISSFKQARGQLERLAAQNREGFDLARFSAKTEGIMEPVANILTINS